MRRGLGIVLAASMLVVPVMSGAAGRSRVPDVFEYVSMRLVAGDKVIVTCEDTLPHLAFMADSFVGGNSAGLTWNNPDLYVDGKLVTAGTSETLSQGGGRSGFTGFGLGVEADRSGRYRAAWASWGGEPLDCTVTKNGLSKQPIMGDRSKATFLMASDFTTGVGVSTTLAGVGPALIYEQDVNGYVFTYLPNEAVLATATAPDGSQQLGTPPFGLNVASGKDGRWTYALAGAANIGGIFGATMVINA